MVISLQGVTFNWILVAIPFIFVGGREIRELLYYFSASWCKFYVLTSCDQHCLLDFLPFTIGFNFGKKTQNPISEQIDLYLHVFLTAYT